MPGVLLLVGSVERTEAVVPRSDVAALPPRVLPGEAHAAVAQEKETWLVGGANTASTVAIARRFAASRVLRRAAVYEVERGRARAFVAALKSRGLYAFSEPNRLVHPLSFPADPLSVSQWAPSSLGLQSLIPPPPGLEETPLGLKESG
jgi:hypothetical protein